MSESECESPVKKRRGSGNIKGVMKEARLKGEEFVTTAGRLVEQKSTGLDCTCKKLCTSRFTNEQKKQIISVVYNGRPKNERDTFLMGLIECNNVNRHRPTSSESRQFQFSFKYFAMKDNNRVEVCRNAFLSLHSISSKVAFRLTSLLSKGKSPVDMRGKHQNHNKIPQEALVKLNEHIESFPKKTSHYSSTSVTYLEAGLSVKKMHDMLIEKHPDLNTVIKYEYFLVYYNVNYGYRFGRPQVDVCSACEELGTKIKSQTLNDNAKRVATAELLIHKRRACKFYKKIQHITEVSRSQTSIAGIVFDFMQNLPLPAMPVQDMFYLRKLWHYVFCVNSLGDTKSVFYTYHEGVAKKGPDEVSSMLNNFIENYVSPDVTELNVFCDSCPGQNRNHTLIRYFSSLTITKRFKKINMYFPVRGHSFLPCDRNFGVIKRVVRNIDRIYSPEQYDEIIRGAKKTAPLFEVHQVKNEDIKDFKKWWPIYFKKTCKSLTQGSTESFKVSKYRHLTFKMEQPGYIDAKEFIDGAVSETFKLFKGGNVILPCQHAYDGKVAIKSAKLADVAKIIQYIPDQYEQFYRNILTWPTSSNMEDDSD